MEEYNNIMKFLKDRKYMLNSRLEYHGDSVSAESFGLKCKLDEVNEIIKEVRELYQEEK